MELYIDKENFINLFKSNSEDKKENKVWKCLQRIRVNFNFEKIEILEIIKNLGTVRCGEENENDNSNWLVNLNAWLKGRGNSESGNEDWKVDYFNNKNKMGESLHPFPNPHALETDESRKHYLSSVYLLNDDKKIESIKDSVLCGGVGKEVETLGKLLYGNMNEPFEFHYLPNFKWENLGNVPPCTDIVICDRFLFCYDGNKKTKDTVRNSIDLMLNSIIPQNSGTVNIVIFIDQTQIEDDLKTSKDTGPDEAEKRIKDAIETIRKHLYEKGLLPNITVIGNDSSCFPYKKRGPHDRLIITNYSLHISGDSFTYFDTSNKPITEGFYMISGSLVDNNIQNHTEKMLDQLNRLYTEPCPCCNIYGDRKSNLIKFDNMTTLPIKGEKLEGKIVSDEQGYKVRCDKFECSFWTGTYEDTVKVNDDVEFTVKYKVKNGRKHLNATKIRLKK